MNEAGKNALRSAKSSFSWMCLALLASRIAANFIYAIVEGVIIAIATYDIPVEADPFPTPEILTYPWITSILTFASQMIGLFVAFRIMRDIPTAKHEETDLSLKDFCIFFLVCYPISLLGSVIGDFLASLLSGGSAVDPLALLEPENDPIMIFYAVSLGPALEEFIFRKQIIDRCVKYGEKTAILFSALCFALFHSNLYQLFYTFGGGLVWGYVYTRTRQLRYTVPQRSCQAFSISPL